MSTYTTFLFAILSILSNKPNCSAYLPKCHILKEAGQLTLLRFGVPRHYKDWSEQQQDEFTMKFMANKFPVIMELLVDKGHVEAFGDTHYRITESGIRALYRQVCAVDKSALVRKTVASPKQRMAVKVVVQYKSKPNKPYVYQLDNLHRIDVKNLVAYQVV